MQQQINFDNCGILLKFQPERQHSPNSTLILVMLDTNVTFHHQPTHHPTITIIWRAIEAKAILDYHRQLS